MCWLRHTHTLTVATVLRLFALAFVVHWEDGVKLEYSGQFMTLEPCVLSVSANFTEQNPRLRWFNESRIKSGRSARLQSVFNTVCKSW